MVKKTKAAQQTHEADLAIEVFFEGVFGFTAFQLKYHHTAQAAKRLMREPLCTKIVWTSVICGKIRGVGD